MSESEIARIKDKIIKYKHIIEKCREMRISMAHMCSHAGFSLTDGYYGDLPNLEMNIEKQLNMLRLQLARLRDE